MAPKRKAGGKGTVKAVTTAGIEEAKEEVQEALPPVTPAKEEDEAEEESPSPKKAKAGDIPEKKAAAAAGKRGKKPKAASKKRVSAALKEAADPVKETVEAVGLTSSKVIIVEASKECNSFKIRAMKVETGLKDAVPGVVVKVNPDKPRKGCFEIRDDEGSIFISLQNMPRPFTKLKSLDLDKTIEEIAGKIK